MDGCTAGTSAGDDVGHDGRDPGPPEVVLPMLAVAGPTPTGAGWAFEFKWDGVRAVTAVGGGEVRVASRNGNDVTHSYPELAVLGDLLAGHRAVLDGEIVALGPDGRPWFSLLQQRMHVQRPSGVLLTRVAVTYYLFDLLWLDGQTLVDQPYQRRRARLDELVPRGATPRIWVPQYYADISGAQLLEVAGEHGLEGVVAKRLASRYEPGRRSAAWVKTALMRTQEVVVGGWKPGEGRRAGTIGSLLLGAHDQAGRLVYVGHVGTGFSDRVLRDLRTRLRELERPGSPFDTPVPREHARYAHWVDPVLVGEVEYRTLTAEGRLRHSAWRGLRPDKTPDEVRLPEPA